MPKDAQPPKGELKRKLDETLAKAAEQRGKMENPPTADDSENRGGWNME